MTEQSPIAVPDGFMRDGKGRLVPEKLVKPVEKLIDQTVRKIHGYGRPLADQVARFKGHCFDDIGALMDLIAAEYQTKLGGAKGNITLMTYDCLLMVKVQVADHMTFGPELQVAKAKVDECIERWATGVNDQIRMLVNHAFQVDQAGRINRAALFQLRRVAIEDDGWQLAMQALTDSIRVVGSKSYIRIYERATVQDQWKPVVIDLAAAERT